MLLILDIDETVVYASTTRLDRPPDFEVAGYFVYRRPGLDEFLKFVSQHFQLAVWSSSGSDYARQIVEGIPVGVALGPPANSPRGLHGLQVAATFPHCRTV
jgi:TFIIF-interacting CTD phosphatase-like protein